MGGGLWGASTLSALATPAYHMAYLFRERQRRQHHKNALCAARINAARLHVLIIFSYLHNALAKSHMIRRQPAKKGASAEGGNIGRR